jgi:outer membrane murein-binding lipoprotein Lpp
MNFALALSSGKIKGVKMDSAQLTGQWALPVDSTLALPILENNLLAGDVSKQTHDSIAAQIADAKSVDPKSVDAKNAAAEKKPAANETDKQGRNRRTAAGAQPANVSVMAGLLLGSPEFQKR